MIYFSLGWELSWEEHVQPGDHICDLEYDEGKCSTEEALKEVANDVIGARDLN